MFPDRIERTIELPHGPERVWTALTTAEGLSGWFGTVAEIDLTPGAEVEMRFEKEGVTAVLQVSVVEPPHRFGYTWRMMNLPDEDPRRTFVEFVLEPIPTGTRLILTESGFAQMPAALGGEAFDGNSHGWEVELGELVDYLSAVDHLNATA
jgi:uncharacterized protein YndB with AHSA1/START domain